MGEVARRRPGRIRITPSPGITLLSCWAPLPFAGAQEHNTDRERAIAAVEKLGARYRAEEPGPKLKIGAVELRPGTRRVRVILNETSVTDAGVKNLERALPKLKAN